MFSKLLKLAAYKKAPVKTFALLHPMKALKWGAVILILRKVFGGGQEGKERQGRRRTSSRSA